MFFSPKLYNALSVYVWTENFQIYFKETINLKSQTRNIMKFSKVFIITFLSAAVNLEIGRKYSAFAHNLHIIDVTQLEPNAFTDPHEILNEGSLTKDRLSFISNPIQDDGHLFQKVN